MAINKEVFWGLYAAILPIININVFGKLERMINQYMSRTYDSVTALYGLATVALLYGIMLAVLARHYLSKPVESNRFSLIGLCIGLVYCVVVFLYWPLGVMGIDVSFLNLIGVYAYGNLRMVSIMGFYAVLLFVYCKNRISFSKEE